MSTRRKPNPNTAAVTAYRARVADAGGATLYCTMDAEVSDALALIMQHRICSKRDAVAYALRRAARECGRKR
jgi:hypothetical protein